MRSSMCTGQSAPDAFRPPCCLPGVDDRIHPSLPFRDGEESCRKQLGRVLSIWQERGVYDSSLLDQLSQVLCKFPQCAGTPGNLWLHHSVSQYNPRIIVQIERKEQKLKHFPTFKCLYANRWREEGQEEAVRGDPAGR